MIDSTKYPRSLYMGGDPNAEHTIVRDEEQEAQAREVGFITIQERLEAERAAAERPVEESAHVGEEERAARSEGGKRKGKK